MTRILGDAQELTSEQIAVFQEDLRAILTADNNKTSVSSLLTNIKKYRQCYPIISIAIGSIDIFL